MKTGRFKSLFLWAGGASPWVPVEDVVVVEVRGGCFRYGDDKKGIGTNVSIMMKVNRIDDGQSALNICLAKGGRLVACYSKTPEPNVTNICTLKPWLATGKDGPTFVLDCYVEALEPELRRRIFLGEGLVPRTEVTKQERADHRKRVDAMIAEHRRRIDSLAAARRRQ